MLIIDSIKDLHDYFQYGEFRSTYSPRYNAIKCEYYPDYYSFPLVIHVGRSFYYNSINDIIDI